MTLDPPSAVAASKCLMARLWRTGTGALSPDAFHPRICAWDDYSRDDLTHLLADFNEEARYEPRSGRYMDSVVETWRLQPHDAQARQIAAAQHPDTEAPR